MRTFPKDERLPKDLVVAIYKGLKEKRDCILWGLPHPFFVKILTKPQYDRKEIEEVFAWQWVENSCENK